MHIERVLQILVASMAVIGSAILCWTGNAMGMFAVMVLAAVGSVVFCDALGWLRLHRALVNFASLAAMFILLGDFLRNDSYTQLMSMGQLLMWWQIVMMFQEKSTRVYWCIAILSLLEIVVASILNMGLQIGPVFVLFVLVALVTLMLFFVHREAQRIANSRLLLVQALKRQADDPYQLLGGPPLTMPDQTVESLERRIRFRALVRPLLLLSLVSVLFAAFFFYGAPRMGDSRWRRLRAGGQVETGFADSVSFPEMGEVLQSRKVVMRVNFTDARTGQPYLLSDGAAGPYFHGAALDNYSEREQRWSRPRRQFSLGSTMPRVPQEVPKEVDIVREEYLLEPTTRRTLFGVLPGYADNADRSVFFDYASQRLVHRLDEESETRTQQLRYRLLTPAFRAGTQLAIRPHGRGNLELTPTERQTLTDIQRDRFPGITALAAEILDESGARGNRLLAAQVLKNHFLSDERYRYSLDFTQVAQLRRESVDPIEDFVTNHRTGHCQYFAAALTMMLRSQGIPARMIVGYHGGNFNKVGGYYQVAQLHAHAWVEAYVESDQLPDNLQTVAAFGRIRGGGWLRLDPTPAAALETDSTRAGNTLDEILDYAKLLWNDYVVELDADRQNQSVYNPLLANTTELREWLNLENWGVFFRNFWGRLGDSLTDFFQEGVSWREGLAVFVVGALLVGAFLGVRKLWSRIRARQRLAAERAWLRSGVRVDFYERLERLLEKAGLRRSGTQTQREWAGSAEKMLAAEPAYANLAQTPMDVVNAYYHVRFGRRELEPAARRNVQTALDQLEERMS